MMKQAVVLIPGTEEQIPISPLRIVVNPFCRQVPRAMPVLGKHNRMSELFELRRLNAQDDPKTLHAIVSMSSSGVTVIVVGE